jgi:ribosomal protein S14
VAEGIHRCAPDDPNRCQGIVANGQCPNLAAENSQYCRRCGGHTGVIRKEKENVRNYQLARFKSRVENKLTAPGIKSLREEIAVLRMLLEERINTCKDDVDLILQSAAIADLIMKVQAVVVACHKLESSMGQHLDKQQILIFGRRIIDIIIKNVDDPAVIERISSDIVTLMEEIGDGN